MTCPGPEDFRPETIHAKACNTSMIMVRRDDDDDDDDDDDLP